MAEYEPRYRGAAEVAHCACGCHRHNPHSCDKLALCKRSFPEPALLDLGAIIKPANAHCLVAALDPAFAADPTGCAVVVPYSFGNEALMVAHVRQLPAVRSSVELEKQFAGFVAEVKAKVGATWLPVYACCDVTKDRTVVDRLVEFGMGAGATPAACGCRR